MHVYDIDAALIKFEEQLPLVSNCYEDTRLRSYCSMGGNAMEKLLLYGRQCNV
ncbi:hypothetical protein L195_g002341 [Trifolium pratense]|uniref:Uncharacterized protein n=1 Tax=Trifolium pratense TaxID=57577 RepID=A0A2K3NS78_TRIPR|nr:hypothetical protein L195_g002341 [Trifolium pratense]